MKSNSLLLESLCFALGLGYKTKKLEIEKREAILEQERHRLRIARDLHDEMGSTLSSISILSEAALVNLQQDIDRSRFSAIGERARQVMEAMSDIVWSVNPANDTMENVLRRMKEFASEILEAQDISLHFESDEATKNLTLQSEQRKDFYLLFKEAVNNAAKYSGARDVWVTVRTEEKGLMLEVRDNGRGFDMAEVKRGNGLWNMERRAEQLGGIFWLESAEGRGTSVRVKL
jgi:signal transduction histidine kinase